MFGGWISLKIGGKITASLAIFLGSVCTLLVNLIVYFILSFIYLNTNVKKF